MQQEVEELAVLSPDRDLCVLEFFLVNLSLFCYLSVSVRYIANLFPRKQADVL